MYPLLHREGQIHIALLALLTHCLLQRLFQWELLILCHGIWSMKTFWNPVIYLTPSSPVLVPSQRPWLIILSLTSSGNSIRKHFIKQYFSSATCSVSTCCCDNNKNSQTLDNTNQQSELKFLLIESWSPWETWAHWWYVNLRSWRNCEMMKGGQWLKVSIYIAWSESSECMLDKVTSETG